MTGWRGIAVLVLAVAAASSACSQHQVAMSAPADEPVASTADPEGRLRGFQFARRYSDVVKVDGKPVRQVVEYGFDYDRGETVRRIYDGGGQLLQEEWLRESLRANDAESARLDELVRTHPVLGPKMSEPGLLVHAGGFVVRDPQDPYCGLRTRCLHYIVSKGDGTIPHVHAIVDLATDRVVYPFYEFSADQPGGHARKAHK